MAVNFVSINGIDWGVGVGILGIERSVRVVEDSNAGTAITGRAIRSIVGTSIGHKVKFFRLDNDYQTFDDLWQWLVEHSTDESVQVEIADGQTTIAYEAYYTAMTQPLEVRNNGVNLWDAIEVTFYPIEPQEKP